MEHFTVKSQHLLGVDRGVEYAIFVCRLCLMIRVMSM